MTVPALQVNNDGTNLMDLIRGMVARETPMPPFPRTIKTFAHPFCTPQSDAWGGAHQNAVLPAILDGICHFDVNAMPVAALARHPTVG
jgi:hypothetical protein